MMMNDGDDVDDCCSDNVVNEDDENSNGYEKKLWKILKYGWLRKDGDEDTWSAWHRKWVKSLPEIFDLGMKGALASFPRQIISKIKSTDFQSYPKISYFQFLEEGYFQYQSSMVLNSLSCSSSINIIEPLLSIISSDA